MLYENCVQTFKNMGVDENEYITFYHTKAGIRFEIGSPYIDCYQPRNFIQRLFRRNLKLNEVYFEDALKRSITLFNALKNDPDILVMKVIFFDDNKKYVDMCFNDIKTKYNLVDPHEVKKFEIFSDYDQEDVCIYLLYWDLTKIEYDVERINNVTIHVDSIGDKKFQDKYTIRMLYFVDIKLDVMYDLYDDRCLDISSASTDSIRHLYEDFNGWILDYDRVLIDSIFNVNNDQVEK